MNPFVVGFTHGTGAIAALIAEQTPGAAPAAAVTFARKNTPVFARNVNAPLAEERTLPRRFSRFAFAPPKIATVAPARAWPPWVTRPLTTAPTPALPDFFAATVTAPAATAAGDATVAATLTLPASGLYG
ncbi:MAG: hypothetical protein H0U00_05370, partial [Actinobacteria bacterium]|nr:hypothetical protein [Actinomycetota bacterium]